MWVGVNEAFTSREFRVATGHGIPPKEDECIWREQQEALGGVSFGVETGNTTFKLSRVKDQQAPRCPKGAQAWKHEGHECGRRLAAKLGNPTG